MAKKADAAARSFTIEIVDAARWPDLERLFEGGGGPHYCWCMVWRDMPNANRRDKTKKKAALKSRVDGGVPVGILAYDGDAPVAWCSVGPRRTVPRLSKDRDPSSDNSVWTIGCFFVQRPYRARGLTAQLIEAAATYAKESGATTIEAFPVAEDAPSYRFLGFVKHFAAAGFAETGRSGRHRHIMQRALI
ncbi:MAG: GNAT family N-acetyltransferase [Alphaproteobacteria bacterium]|nr:GNAT family N-acetyltransferase [Alphaproteobacteria bacterium]